MTLLFRFIREECAATAVEYALVAAIIGGVLIIGFGALTGNLQSLLEFIAGKLTV